MQEVRHDQLDGPCSLPSVPVCADREVQCGHARRSAVKSVSASTSEGDVYFTEGSAMGQAFRDTEWEEMPPPTPTRTAQAPAAAHPSTDGAGGAAAAPFGYYNRRRGLRNGSDSKRCMQ